MNRTISLLALCAASFAAAQLSRAGTLTEPFVERTGVNHVVVQWKDAAPVDVLLAYSPDADLESAKLVSDNDADGRHELDVDPARRPYFILRDEQTGATLRVAERLVALEAGSNFRDVGGYPGADGLRVRWGKIYRSGATPLLTDRDVSYIEKLGIRSMIDLRSTEERRLAPTRLKQIGGVRYVANDYPMMSMFNRAAPTATDAKSSSSSTVIANKPAAIPPDYISQMYRDWPTSLAPQYKAIFQALLAGEGAVEYNCSAGQDRTGVATALVLTALGVPREVIVQDYHLSTTFRRPEYEMAPIDLAQHKDDPAAAMFARARENPQAMRPQPLKYPDGRPYLNEALKEIETRWGSIESYLDRELGIDERALAQLRQAYLEPGARPQARYTKQEAMIPMRDGVKLYTQIYVPKDAASKHPILLQRTPYNVGSYKAGEMREVIGPSPAFDSEDYVVAYQEVRGKGRSGGEFFHHPPYLPKKGRKQADESSDAYDTIAWLVKNIPSNNGRVGIWGISAAGYTSYMSLLDPHPALRAASPQGGPGVEFLGDDYRHYGAFRPMIAFDWTWRYGISGLQREGFDYGTPDGYQFFLELGPMANVNRRHFKDKNAAWNEYIDHPDYDEFWRDRDVSRHINSSKVPVLTVIGWFDQDDYYGPWTIFKQLEGSRSQPTNYLAVGPWAHGDWRRGTGEQLGDMTFGSRTSEYFQQRIELAFFNHFLKDKGAAPARITAFETGQNRWHEQDRWPPRGTPKRLYLHAGGTLSFDPPREADGVDEYLSDPAKPVPWSEEIRTNHGIEWIVADQRFAARRPDVLVYQSEPLSEDVTIAGSILARMFFSTTGTDADIVLKLIDVFPGNEPDPQPNPRSVKMGGYQMMIAGEVFRARYLKSFSQPQALVPGAVNELYYDLLDKYHTFKQGHRIMVQVQSSWFPIVDRNPQKFVPNIAHAAEADFQKATLRIHRSPQRASHLEVNVLSGAN